MMSLVPAAIGRTVARNALLVQKGSPGLLLGAGIVGMVGSTVLACRATLKMEALVGETKGKLLMARTLKHDDYSEADRSRDVSLIYFQSSVKVIRLYGPAIVVGGLSIAALTRSHNILTQRNAALTAAYAALDKGFREYRARVVERYGEEEDRHLRYGTREVAIEDPETQKRELVTRVDATGEPSIYAKWFDQHSNSWSKEPEYNFVFLQSMQNYANDLLHARGHVFLNDVYDMLGIERTKAGAVVGWVLTSDGSSDNWINFGVFDDRERARDFVNGFEGAILLDFNVDGVIYDKIEHVHREALSWQRNR
jgi:hypothetical protein